MGLQDSGFGSHQSHSEDCVWDEKIMDLNWIMLKVPVEAMILFLRRFLLVELGYPARENMLVTFLFFALKIV